MFSSPVSLHENISIFIPPCSNQMHFLYVRLQRSDNQLGVNACGKGTGQERLEKCPGPRIAPTPLKASSPPRHSPWRQSLVKDKDSCKVQRCRERWRGLQVRALRERACNISALGMRGRFPQRHKLNLAVPLGTAFRLVYDRYSRQSSDTKHVLSKDKMQK